MKDITHMASLLTYLEPVGNNFFLNLSLITQDTSLPEENLFPFIIANDSDSLARLIEARITSDAGSEVKGLFLFVQRDWYTLKKNALWPFNNNDVRDFWQKTLSFYVDGKRDDRSFILFSNQLSKKGEILPFSSLFYCKKTKVFFHPPCPKCGRILQQCEDDNLLRASGLYPFSTSLKRYLFCPGCGSPNFYLYEMEQSDPSFLKDRWTLIKSFAELKKTEQNTAFPCIGCYLHEECYGKDNRVLKRVVPFSFYPFYMFAFEAASLNAVDFIALISGADFQEAKSLAESNREFGRVASLKAVEQACAGNIPFLFDHDGRHFLEILYLKLSFLEEVVRNFQSCGKFINPDLKPGIDQIWVKFPVHSGMLPFYWNFKIEILCIGRHTSFPLLSKPMPDSLFLIGLIWFYALLTNKRQNISDVLVYLEKVASEETGSFEKYVNESVFNPLNIFWEPQGKIIESRWNVFWERSLRLGWSLLNLSFQTVDQGREKFLQRMKDLRRDIKENLFMEEIPGTAAALNTAEAASHDKADDAIREILYGIINKLRPTISTKKEAGELKVNHTAMLTAIGKPLETPQPPIDEDIEEPTTETVILSARPSEKDVTISPALETPKTPQIISARKTEAELQETVISSSEDSDKKAKSPTKNPEEIIAETIVMSTVLPMTKEVDEEEDEARQKMMPVEDRLAETVILKPGEKQKTREKLTQ